MPHRKAGELANMVGAAVPYLRRYARALTGSQQTGDRFSAAALEAMLSSGIAPEDDVRLALFSAFHVVWTSAGAPVGDADTALSRQAQRRMAMLTPHTREALLLHAIEGFDLPQVAQILNIDAVEAAEYIEIARREMSHAMRGRVLIIEDEAIISMDIAAIVDATGHRVTGIARTHSEAVELAARERPDLILADIRLADNSSGIDAVNDILSQFESVPVIFISAYPERLLTGDRPEPAFLITKPFSEDQILSAVSQAMFFASTETLAA